MDQVVQAGPPKLPAPPTRRFRILIVDDDRDSVDLLRKWLAMEGYEVLGASSGKEALERMGNDRPDLVLLDLMIPPPDGLEVLRTAKKDRALSTIPLVIMTVKRDVKSKVECLRGGADDFIVKPFHFDELDAILRASLKKRYLYASLERTNRQLKEANEKLTRLSVTDDRTNLLNDRYLRRRLAEEFKRAQRYGNPLSVMMLDLDHFKQINDKYGHDCGDQVLREFGRLVTENAREIDIVGRFGGEEFLIILPSTDGIRAAIVAERVRKAAEERIYKYKEFLVRITVSAGISSIPANRELRSDADLLKAADNALYRAKQVSRNKVIVDRASMPSDILEGDLSSIFNASYEDAFTQKAEDEEA
ncbi:MAG TPA: diguanylate cyclase [Candidatus Polarisedimenticolia bacterium]|nr:diguanylate cyclase [Candidatus Polarisedimenticolia bacterium]